MQSLSKLWFHLTREKNVNKGPSLNSSFCSNCKIQRWRYNLKIYSPQKDAFSHTLFDSDQIVGVKASVWTKEPELGPTRRSDISLDQLNHERFLLQCKKHFSRKSWLLMTLRKASAKTQEYVLVCLSVFAKNFPRLWFFDRVKKLNKGPSLNF